jgi:hypothetical protein
VSLGRGDQQLERSAVQAVQIVEAIGATPTATPEQRDDVRDYRGGAHSK